MVSYSYRDIRGRLFSDAGQAMFMKIRESVRTRLASAGAVRMWEAIDSGVGGDFWTLMACVDRLVELGEIKEIPQGDAAGHHRIFVAV